MLSAMSLDYHHELLHPLFVRRRKGGTIEEQIEGWFSDGASTDRTEREGEDGNGGHIVQNVVGLPP